MFAYIRLAMGVCLHFRTNVRLPGTAHLFHPQTPYKISISEHFHPNNHFDTEFDKTPILRHFRHSHHTKNHQKYL